MAGLKRKKARRVPHLSLIGQRCLRAARGLCWQPGRRYTQIRCTAELSLQDTLMTLLTWVHGPIQGFLYGTWSWLANQLGAKPSYQA